MGVSSLPVAALLCAGLSRVCVSQVRPALASLPPQRQVRLELVDSTFVVGRLLALQEGHVLVRTIERPTVTAAHFEDRTVVLDSIARAWTREGSYWKTGALVGLATGTVSVFVTMHAVADELDCGPVRWRCAAFSLAVGGAPGAMLGALVGGGVVRWRLVF